MQRTLAMLVTVAVVLTACGTGRDTGTGTTAGSTIDTVADATRAACDPELDTSLRAWAAAGFSGSVAISTDGAFDCVAGYGTADESTDAPNTTSTVFSIGSVSKAFTAAAVLDLVDAGLLSLDDRAGEIVTDLTGPAAEATIEQLLLHTSGLTGSHGSDHEPLDRGAAVAAISNLESAFEPGTDFLYSNTGYTLLALIVEAASGTTYRDYMVSEILPLPDGTVAGGFWDGAPAVPGPRAVGYLDDGPTDEMGDFDGPHWALDGNGDLAMTAQALATWTHALFTGHVISPESVSIILSGPGFDLGDGASETPGWVAYDESIFGEPFLAAAGGGGDVGHNAVAVWVPDGERVIVITSNGPDVTAEDLLQAIGPALVAGDPLPQPDPPADDIDPADLEAVAGTYELDSGGSFDVTARDGKLAISANGSAAIAALFPLPSDRTEGEVVAHEADVLSLLAGETQQGREEREILESDFGTIDAIDLVGTIVDDGELRTYVAVTSATGSITLWYALDEAGGIAAAEGPTEPPTQLFVPSGGGFRPDDPTGRGADVTVEFDAGGMTVSNSAGTTVAELAA